MAKNHTTAIPRLRAELIPTSGEVMPALDLAAIPRVGDTLDLDEGPAWLVTRIHWPFVQGATDRVQLHLARAAVEA